MRRAKKWALVGVATLVGAELVLRLWLLLGWAGPPGFLSHQTVDDPALGFRLRPDLHVRADFLAKGLAFTFDTNERGLRGPPTAEPKPAGEFRVLLFGNSCLFGVGVESGQTMAAELERQLRGRHPALRVVNGGSPGYALVQMRRFLSVRGPGLQPDLVVAVLCRPDLSPEGYVRVDGFIFRAPTLVAGHVSFLYEYLKVLKDFHGAPEPVLDVATVVSDMQAEVGGWHVPFLVADVPGDEETRFARAHPLLSDRGRTPPPRAITVDLRPAFAALQQTPYLPDGHLNPDGHALVGRVLGEELERRGLLPPPPAGTGTAPP